MLRRMILVFGANGQVGGALCRLLGQNGTGLGRKEADFTYPHALEGIVARFSPAAVINASAYTKVDAAETERAAAFTVNAEAPGVLARACAARGIPFVHYSTDYVFDGSGTTPWTEADATHPINAYGESKRAGEEATAAAGGKHLILRTSWVYDETGQNFLNTMLRLARVRSELRVVADQHGAPTYAGHLAAATLAALSQAVQAPVFPSGIYHLCGGGETTWHGFARAIVAQAAAHETLAVQDIAPIATEQFPTPAARPRNSRLNCEKAARVLGVQLPAWQDGLVACMNHRYGHHPHPAA